MGKVTTRITLDADVKAQAQELFADFGLNLSTAIDIFLRQSIRENCIPFPIEREVPNADTIAAIKELEEMKAHPERYKRYDSFAEILEEVKLEMGMEDNDA